MNIEKLAEEVHKIYCAQYLKDHGKPYWTEGDYSKLDEKTKQYDRNIVLWHQEKLEALLDSLKEDIAKPLYDKTSYFEDGNKPSWVVRGNSDVQNACRALASAIIKSKK